MEPTKKQIEQLYYEAGAAGDFKTCEICRIALDNVQWAINEVARIIREARAMED